MVVTAVKLVLVELDRGLWPSFTKTDGDRNEEKAEIRGKNNELVMKSNNNNISAKKKMDF